VIPVYSNLGTLRNELVLDSYVQLSILRFYSLYTENEGDCMSEAPSYNGLISKFSVT
jgi:hypothetical protein